MGGGWHERHVPRPLMCSLAAPRSLACAAPWAVLPVHASCVIPDSETRSGREGLPSMAVAAGRRPSARVEPESGPRPLRDDRPYGCEARTLQPKVGTIGGELGGGCVQRAAVLDRAAEKTSRTSRPPLRRRARCRATPRRRVRCRRCGALRRALQHRHRHHRGDGDRPQPRRCGDVAGLDQSDLRPAGRADLADTAAHGELCGEANESPFVCRCARSPAMRTRPGDRAPIG